MARASQFRPAGELLDAQVLRFAGRRAVARCAHSFVFRGLHGGARSRFGDAELGARQQQADGEDDGACDTDGGLQAIGSISASTPPTPLSTAFLKCFAEFLTYTPLRE